MLRDRSLPKPLENGPRSFELHPIDLLTNGILSTNWNRIFNIAPRSISINSDTSYEEIFDALSQLLNLSVDFKYSLKSIHSNKKNTFGYGTSRVFIHFYQEQVSDEFVIEINSSVYGNYINLAEGYSEFWVKQVLQLTDSPIHTGNQILTDKFGLKRAVYSVSELRSFMNIEPLSYCNPEQLHERVIVPAIDEIVELANCLVVVEY